MNIDDDTRSLIRFLKAERSQRAQDVAGPASTGRDELFAEFRALVNTRPPAPLPKEIEAVQDRMLRAMIARAGVTNAACLQPCASDARLSIWRGDITTLAADAIVNAANSQMLGCWIPGHLCIDNAIHTFAGVQLRMECARLMRAQGHGEPTGQAKVTPAFNLPSKWIIHTVGPIVGGATPTGRDCELLSSCYRSCLDAAAERGCGTIAFCCISTGVFAFPQERAANIAVETVRAWLDAHEQRKLHVVFNVFSGQDEEIYHAILDEHIS